MSYEKQTWATGDIITADKLNHMEDGIAGAGGDVEYVITEQTVTTNGEGVAELNVDYEFTDDEWVIFKGLLIVDGDSEQDLTYVANKFDLDGFAQMNLSDSPVTVYIEDDAWYLGSEANLTYKLSAIKMPNF